MLGGMSDQPHATAPGCTDHSAPQTIEGWYVLHDAWQVDWVGLRQLTPELRRQSADELASWLTSVASHGGGSAVYQVVGQKAALVFLHYRAAPADLTAVSVTMQRRLAIAEHLRPAGSFVSVIEASLYEATAMARGLLARRGMAPGHPDFDRALDQELAVQRSHLNERVFRTVPAGRHLCFYPMSKRRGEQVNWYTLSMDERRALMRSHGQLGARFKDRVTQVVSGAVGLDDWEWAVDLHADDPLVFKHLIHAMRFDEASAKYAEFGPFMIGERLTAEHLGQLING